MVQKLRKWWEKQRRIARLEREERGHLIRAAELSEKNDIEGSKIVLGAARACRWEIDIIRTNIHGKANTKMSDKEAAEYHIERARELNHARDFYGAQLEIRAFAVYNTILQEGKPDASTSTPTRW